MQHQVNNPRKFTEETPERPERAEQDWDQMEDVEIVPDHAVTEDELDEELEGDLPEEDDDNPFQESDEALPDDEEERYISRHLPRE